MAVSVSCFFSYCHWIKAEVMWLRRTVEHLNCFEFCTDLSLVVTLYSLQASIKICIESWIHWKCSQGAASYMLSHRELQPGGILPLNPHPALLLAALFPQFQDGNGCWRSWGWLRQKDTSEWKQGSRVTGLAHVFYPRHWKDMEGRSSVHWVPSFPSLQWVCGPVRSPGLSHWVCHRAWCCISMTSHKSRQEEACETGSHERSELAGGEMLAGVYIVKLASFFTVTPQKCMATEWAHEYEWKQVCSNMKL